MPFAAMRLRNESGAAPPTNTYAALVMASSPNAYWRLGETSGTIAIDTTGAGRNGTYSRNASLTTTAGLLVGDSNTAFLGPPTASSPESGITFGAALADPGSNFTTTVIIQPSGVPHTSGLGVLMQLGSFGGGAPELAIVDQGGGLFKIRVGRTAVGTLFTSTSSWAYGTKLHVKLSRDTGDLIALRVNGAAEGSTTFNFASFNTGTALGGYNGGGSLAFSFSGVIDEFAAWTSFISDATTDAQYAAI